MKADLAIVALTVVAVFGVLSMASHGPPPRTINLHAEYVQIIREEHEKSIKAGETGYRAHTSDPCKECRERTASWDSWLERNGLR